MTNSYKYSFLILHYKAIEETVKCITSIIEKIDCEEYQIVVVDNGSPDGSGKLLKEKYAENNLVHIIVLEKNLGFANGNNVGFRYARNNYHADFICMMNNDTEIIQNDFTKVIENEYESSRFGVLGPLIHLPKDDYYFIITAKPSLESIEHDIKKQTLLRQLNKFYIRDILIKGNDAKKAFIRIFKKWNKNIFERHEDILLNGCCLIFSPEYLKVYDNIGEKTFMYREEEFIWFMCKYAKLKMVYNPKLQILHLEDASTDQSIEKSRDKNEFFYKHSLDSMNELIKYIRENE